MQQFFKDLLCQILIEVLSNLLQRTAEWLATLQWL